MKPTIYINIISEYPLFAAAETLAKLFGESERGPQ
jgi:hypothetical protein